MHLAHAYLSPTVKASGSLTILSRDAVDAYINDLLQGPHPAYFQVHLKSSGLQDWTNI